MEDYEILLVRILPVFPLRMLSILQLNTTSITDWSKSCSHLRISTTPRLSLDPRKIKVDDDSNDEKVQLKDNLPVDIPQREGPPYDFSSLHGTGICMGWFLPSPDDPASHREVQNCVTGYFTDGTVFFVVTVP